MERKFEAQARILRDAIEKFASNESNLDNFQWYLENHFDVWLEKWASDPDGLASEFKHFAEMEV